MSRSAITKLFVGSVIAVFAGVLLAVAALIGAFAGGGFIMDGPDVVGIANPQLTWPLIVMMVVGGLAIVGGGIGGLVAWIGALLNTVQLDDKTWFVLLLVLGLLSFGFVAMVAYAIAGPDGSVRQAPGMRSPMNVGSGA